MVRILRNCALSGDNFGSLERSFKILTRRFQRKYSIASWSRNGLMSRIHPPNTHFSSGNLHRPRSQRLESRQRPNVTFFSRCMRARCVFRCFTQLRPGSGVPEHRDLPPSVSMPCRKNSGCIGTSRHRAHAAQTPGLSLHPLRGCGACRVLHDRRIAAAPSAPGGLPTRARSSLVETHPRTNEHALSAASLRSCARAAKQAGESKANSGCDSHELRRSR
jgi:hypothetical protein